MLVIKTLLNELENLPLLRDNKRQFVERVWREAEHANPEKYAKAESFARSIKRENARRK